MATNSSAQITSQKSTTLQSKNTSGDKATDLAAKFSNTSLSGNRGLFNLSHIPVRPRLTASTQIQCCAKDGGSCSCASCAATRAQEPAAGSSPASIDTSEQIQAEGENLSGTSAEGFIIDDSASDITEGQLKKTEFIRQLREHICTTIEPVLAMVGQTTEGCPYLNHWLNLYQTKEATEVERTVRRYAPGSVNAKSASEYISIVAQRALQSAIVWAGTGRITGIPEGVSTNLPGETSTHSSSENPVQAKEKTGGIRNANDPRAIKKELGEGQPLAPGVQSTMETAFGANFSNVRIHTDSNASAISNRVNARAFTVGNHVAFGTGEYHPGTVLGDALIAHELAHTIQQQSAKASVDKMEVNSSTYNQLEADADVAAESAVATILNNERSEAVPKLRSGISLQRCSKNQTPTCSQGQKSITVDLIKMRGSSRNPASDLAYANTLYSACCINFAVGQDITVPNNLSDRWLGGDTDANFSGITCAYAPPEEAAMYAGATAQYNLGSRMRAFYVHTFSGYAAGGFSRPPYCAGGNAAPFVNHLVLQDTAPQSGLAHELGHILLNNGDHETALPDNMMGPAGGSTIDATRCTTMYNNA